MRSKSLEIIRAAGISLAISLSLVRCALAADQQSFGAPEDAIVALVAAARSGDRAALTGMFGPDSEDLFFSGDDVADLNTLSTFAEWADAGTRLVAHGDDEVELVVGEDDWPLPIPLVKTGDAWRFNTAAGREEILNRRIGANEIGAMDICRAFVDAQFIYVSADRDGDGVLEFAQKILSDGGTRNGLFWKAADFAGDPSPIGPLAAEAAEEGYRRKEGGQRAPYHGYFFRILEAQGEHAPGGKKSYLAGDNMTGGFAVIASPAEYGVSGVMTFLINRNGILFQKDLGEAATRAAVDLAAYDPDDSWTVVED